MKAVTMLRIAEALQLLKLDGHKEFTYSQLSSASGINAKTLQRNAVLIHIIDFALHRKEYLQCIAHI
jgi:hypothetical protein